MISSQDTSQTYEAACARTKADEVLAAFDAAVALALAAGFDADEIIDTVGAMVYPRPMGDPVHHGDIFARIDASTS